MIVKMNQSLRLTIHKFIAEFGFLTNTSFHLANVNLKLQQRQQLICILFSHVKAIQAELNFLKSSLAKKM